MGEFRQKGNSFAGSNPAFPNNKINKIKMKLIKIKKEFEDWEEKHKHDYRWFEDKKEREEWIRKHWEIEEEN